MKLYKKIGRSFESYLACKNFNPEWADKHLETCKELTDSYMPSGSGIDAGVTFNESKSNKSKLVFDFCYHHMRDGMYIKWTYHTLVLTPSFQGYDMKITGENYNDVKDYLYQTFEMVLSEDVG